MKIGELARAAGCKVQTVRYYESEGLLPAARRDTGGYRRFSAADLARLQLVRRCRALGMGMDDIRTILRFLDDPAADCGAVDELLDHHIEAIRQRMASLAALDAALKQLRGRCSTARTAGECGILRAIAEGFPESPEEAGRSADS